MKRTIAIFVFVAVLLSSVCTAGSIWDKRSSDMRSLYVDDVAWSIGDVITVIISEDSTIDNKAKRDLKKESDRSTTFNGKIGNFTDLGEFGISTEYDNELKGKADYKDQRKFSDRITLVVVDVLPNKNLVVMGSRHRNIAGDNQLLEASGIVRPSDISFDNTVKSERVADFRLVIEHTGVAAPNVKQGWLGRILDVVWPF